MTPQEAYKKFLLKVNKNDTNANVKVPKSQFVLLFNEEKRKFMDEVSSRQENSDYIEDIEELLELDKELIKVSEQTNKTNFTLPPRFYKRVGGYSVATKGSCKNITLTNWFIKPKDKDVLAGNSNQSPSFEYRETLALLNSGKVSVYKDGFTINKAYLSYYREPLDINIAGYKQLDGQPSVNAATDLSDRNIDLIIDRAATEAVRNYQSTEQLQLALQRKAQTDKQ